MQVVTIDGTRWRGLAHLSQSLDTVFISDKVSEVERESLLDRLRQSQSKTIWR